MLMYEIGETDIRVIIIAIQEEHSCDVAYILKLKVKVLVKKKELTGKFPRSGLYMMKEIIRLNIRSYVT